MTKLTMSSKRPASARPLPILEISGTTMMTSYFDDTFEVFAEGKRLRDIDFVRVKSFLS
jgi:hypothetical protein